jgi:ADP-ribose pyrophosphatase YjhB (NUDIX family)
MNRRRGLTGRLPRPLYWLTQKLSPVVCVDILPRRVDGDVVEFGLIRRESDRGDVVWALVGGGVHRGETTGEALRRHLRETLGTQVRWTEPDTAYPSLIAEYFPWERPTHGLDSRKHAVALTYLVDVAGHPEAQGEALDFRWFRRDELPSENDLWRGQRAVVSRLLEADEEPGIP